MEKIINFYSGEKDTPKNELHANNDASVDALLDDDEFDEFIEEFKPVAKKIRLLALDVDGVLTDGTIYLGTDGELFKGFNAKDGMGISYAIRSGLKVCLITGRSSEIIRRRAQELGITCVLENVKDKAQALSELARAEGISLENTAYIGDDLNDLAPMAICGWAFAPADAADAVLDNCDLVLLNDGGKGAVREAIDLLLSAQGKLDHIIEAYLHSGQGDKQ